MTNPGGLSDTKLADDTVKKLLNSIIDQLKEQTKIESDSLSVHSYKTQVVAGVIYYIKVNIDDNKFIHLKVMQHLPHTNTSPQLLSHLLNKSVDDKIIFF